MKYEYDRTGDHLQIHIFPFGKIPYFYQMTLIAVYTQGWECLTVRYNQVIFSMLRDGWIFVFGGFLG